MEVLTNLIITIAVIIFVMKRMAEVAKKGGDITKMPTPGEMFPERPETPEAPEMRQREIFEEERPGRYGVPDEETTASDERARAQSTRMQERLREIQRRFDAQRMAAEERAKVAEERFEETRADTGHAPKGTPLPKTRAHRQRKRQSTPVPVFGRGALVQGIVMSEILGPPVSMREAGRW